MSSAKHFVRGRKDKLSITRSTTRTILSYLIFCYQKILLSTERYSKSEVKSTAYNFEDFLKMELVDKYLVTNKHLIQDKLSLKEINFNYETQKRFTDHTGKRRVDKIDIYINKLGLQESWNEPDEHVYLAVECKRIRKISDNKSYITDIEKFCLRDYLNLRLPFEGMIGFIENPKLKSKEISDNLNSLLKTSATINTIEFLAPHNLVSGFEDSYLSNHQRIDPKNNFFVYHLYFDYSNLISV